MPPSMTVPQIEAFLDREFPQLHEGGRVYSVERIDADGVQVRLAAGERHLRPGGTISGPSIMALADLAAYVAILARAGPVGLALTTSLNINFLRKPQPGPLLASCRLLKLGRTLAVAEIAVASESSPEILAHATATYSLPPTAGPAE